MWGVVAVEQVEGDRVFDLRDFGCWGGVTGTEREGEGASWRIWNVGWNHMAPRLLLA